MGSAVFKVNKAKNTGEFLRKEEKLVFVFNAENPINL